MGMGFLLQRGIYSAFSGEMNFALHLGNHLRSNRQRGFNRQRAVDFGQALLHAGQAE